MKNVLPYRYSRRSRTSGFSLVEMIGVLAIIAILAVIIVPKVFSTIASARVTNAASSITSMKASVADFVGKYGSIPTTNANSRVDDLLVAASLLETRFTTKVGTQPSNPPIAGATWTNTNGTWTAAGGASQATQSRLICLTSNTNPPNTANGANYQLDGATNLPAGTRVISAVLVNITGSEARELSQKLDGDSLTQATATTADAAGRVVYNTPNGAGLTTAYVYITSQ